MATAAVTGALLLAIPSGYAFAAISKGNDLGTASLKSSGTSLVITLTSSVTDGNSVIIGFAMDDAAGGITCSDDSGAIPANSYAVDVDVTNGGNVRTVIISAHNVSGITAGTNITITHPNATARAASATEFSGLLPSSVLDRTQSATGSSANPSSGTTASTTSSNELLIGAIGVEGPMGDTFTKGANWDAALSRSGTTGASAASNITIDPEYWIVSVMGAYEADGTITSRDWAAAIATYKEYTDVSVTSRGTQEVALVIPSTNQYVGGSFVISSNGGSRTVTGIMIREHGTVDARSDLDNIKLHYELDTSDPYDCAGETYGGTESQFGSTDTDGFITASGTSTFTDSVGISTTSTLCVYVVLDVGSGASDLDTLDISIAFPASHVTVTSSTVGPDAAVELSGSTWLVSASGARSDDYTQDGNIVSWWYLDESSGTRYDGSSNNNDLTDNNSVSLNTNYNKEGTASASFTRASDHSLSLPDNPSLSITSDLTIVGWIRRSAMGTAEAIVSKFGASGSKSYVLRVTSDNKLQFTVSSDGSTETSVTGTTGLSSSTWYHVAGVFDDSNDTIDVFLIGASNSASAASFTSSINDNASAFRIGELDDGNENFDGLIDEVAVFSRALSESEIDDIYKKGLDGKTRIWEAPWSFPVPYNSRSIGENTGTVYGTGTVTLSQGSRRAIFSGAELNGVIGEGDVLTIGATPYTIAHRESSTAVTVQAANVSGSDHSGAAYTISRAYSGSDETPFSTWEADTGYNLVTPDVIERGICYRDGDGVFDWSAVVYFSGATTNSSHFRWLTVNPFARHNGTAGTGVILESPGAGESGLDVGDNYARLQWLEFKGFVGTSTFGIGMAGSGILVTNVLAYDFDDGSNEAFFAKVDGTGTIRNSIIYNGRGSGIRTVAPAASITVQNCTIYDIASWAGLDEISGTINATNTIVMGCATDFNITGTQSNNISSDATAAGTGSLTNRTATADASPGAGDWVVFTSLTAGSEDLHLQNSSENDALNGGSDLSSSFAGDIDGDTRPTGAGTWDIGADEIDASVTAVELVSFTAKARDSAVELTWETASELDNLGFHLYRCSSPEGRHERITSRPIPGLGSSPAGARYQYIDSGLTNGVTYHYEVEDIETTGKTERHGPVSATPTAGMPPLEGEDSSSSRLTYGDPSADVLEARREGDELVLELRTGGFHAQPQNDGTVVIEIPDYVSTIEEGHPSLPVRRSWVEVLAGRKVKLVSAERFEEEVIDRLTPSFLAEPEIEASRRGTLRVARARRSNRTSRRARWYPEEAARLVEVGYQGEVKKALVEMAPLRWDGRRLVLARRMVVRLSLRGRDAEDRMPSRLRARRGRESQSVVARLVTHERGLYAASLNGLFGRRRTRVRSDRIRLSRQGVSVPYHVEGDRLYFLSEGAEANPYGNEAVYELEVGVSGAPMLTRDASPSGATASHYWESVEREENHLYYSTLLQSPDRWLWKMLFAPSRERFGFTVSALAPSSESSRLELWLQGASDLPEDLDHHVRVHVNGSFITETRWDGKSAQKLEVELLPGSVHEGENFLELENVGDTEAGYSMVLVDSFRLTFPRLGWATAGVLEGRWSESGTAEVSGMTAGSLVLDTTGDPVWLEGLEAIGGTLRFGVESGSKVLAVSPEAVFTPEIRKPLVPQLKRGDHEADWLAIGPREFLAAAEPLVLLRRNEGLRAKAVPIEEVYSEFGFGETTPEALRDFLAYAYHHWEVPPRYVVLLGDATYDFKDWLGTGVVNRVPPLLVETTYLETVSDPSLAAVNGDDSLPDLAIGRLPAAEGEELEAMVDKIVAFEASRRSLDGHVVLVADNPDGAGNFQADAEELSATVLSSREVSKIYLGETGSGAARDAIRAAFDEGASLMSYIGHGGIHLWADENVLNIYDVPSLSQQSERPLLLTMNCLNGFFHFPYFDALSEALLKAEGKGVVAAFSPSGLSLNGPAHRFHKALLNELLLGRHERLGDAVRAAQEAYAETGAFPELLRIYHLFGDPAMRLGRLN